MRSPRESIDRVLDHLRFFLGAPEVRAMHVLTTEQLLPALTGAIAAFERTEDSRSPILVLVTPGTGADRGWTARTAELLNEFGDFRDAASKWELDLRPVATPPTTGIAGFAVALAGVLRSLREPLLEAILLLAPGSDAAALSGDLGALLRQPSLAPARWIAVEVDGDLALPIHELGGEASLLVQATPGEDDLEAEAAATHRLHVAVLGATAALSAKDAAKAMEQFRAARDLCIQYGMNQEAVAYEMTVASIALGTDPQLACETFEAAFRRASALGDRPMVIRAAMGHAGALVAAKRFLEAAAIYRAAGDLGGAEHLLLAIDAYRISGQLLADQRRAGEAVEVWRQALALAEQADVTRRMGSTAPEVARALADLCARHRLDEQAQALRAQAQALEAPSQRR